MKANVSLSHRLKRIIKKNGLAYSEVARQIRENHGTDITDVCIADYARPEVMERRKWVEDKKIEAVKKWMKGMLLQEEAEGTRGFADGAVAHSAAKNHDAPMPTSGVMKKAKMIHAVMSSELFTAAEKEEIATLYFGQ